MSLSTSRWAKPPHKEGNQWEDYIISEGNMTDLIASFLQSMSATSRADNIKRVVIGDLTNGQYVLAVEFNKKGGVKKVGKEKEA